MGELLKAAVGCIEPPTLFERELHILAEIARRADDITGPVLAANGMIRQARTGRVEHPGGGQFTERVRWGVVESRLFVFTATGWLQAVDDPAEDGAYQLNVARLARLLDVAEAGLASGPTANCPAISRPTPRRVWPSRSTGSSCPTRRRSRARRRAPDAVRPRVL